MVTNSEEYLQFQSEHQDLLAKYEQDGKSLSFLPALLDYIQRVRVQSELIESTEDRSQLRANVDFWASIGYEISGTYPNTKLSPFNPIKTEIIKIEKAIQTQEKLRDIIPAQQLESVLSTLHERLATLQSQLSGEGAVAQGERAIAVGERGVYVSGHVSGDIVTNIVHYKAPLSEEQREQLIIRYLNALIRAYDKWELRSLNENLPNTYQLQDIYVELETKIQIQQSRQDREFVENDRQSFSALEAAVNYPRLVILGDLY